MEMRASIELSGLVEEQRLIISIILSLCFSPSKQRVPAALYHLEARVAFFLQIPIKSLATFRGLPSSDPSMLRWLPGASSSQNHVPDDHRSIIMIRIGPIYICLFK